MLEMLKMRRDALKELVKTEKGLQKGFTLIEMIVVIVIILILLSIAVAAFNFLGQVDGTELGADSKKVETAVVQVSLSDDNRDTPALGITGSAAAITGSGTSAVVTETASPGVTDAVGLDNPITRKGTAGALKVNTALITLPANRFDSAKDSKVVLEKTAAKYGLTEATLRALLRPVNANKIQKNVAGKADATNYFVVVRKAQLYDTGVTAIDNAFSSYNDELANQVFSKETVIDNDGFHYNGTFKAKK